MSTPIIVIAPDSFKGSMTAFVAAAAIEKGLRRIFPDFTAIKAPMADGGEGTVQTMVDATHGKMKTVMVSDPLGRPIAAAFGLSGDNHTAIIEMAAANGLFLLKSSERNPLLTTTQGTGEMIKAALDMGVKKIVLGIGGSATNDGGMGMAQALGARFLDANGQEIAAGGGALVKLARIDLSHMDKRLHQLPIQVACDVDNRLCGLKGASAQFGPQKGATPAMVQQLDAGLKKLAEVIQLTLGTNILDLPGGGAAGGLGAGVKALLGGQLRPGVDIVIDTIGLKDLMKDAHLVITGEGRMDGQTANGKAPAGVARTAKLFNLPVIAICGSLGSGARDVHEIGIDAYFSALTEPVAEEDLPWRGPEMLTDCAEQVGRVIQTLLTQDKLKLKH